MPSYRKRLLEWGAVLLGTSDHNRGDGGGRRNPCSIELLAAGPEYAREWSNSLSSVWEPVWYTGWHTGVLACATSVVVVLFINVRLTIHAATNQEYETEGGVGTLYSGSCEKSQKVGMWLRSGINVLSTLLLSGSNYTQQCLAAPTRSEIDAAHARRRWMDIGIPSVRNLFRIKLERALLWIAIGVTGIPLHLLYNSAVYSSIAANDFTVTVVTSDHFERVSHMDMAEVYDYYTYNIAEVLDQEMLLYSSVLMEYSTRPESYEYLTPSECIKIYKTEFVSSHRNLLLITEHSSNATHNNTLIDIIDVRSRGGSPSSWMCGYSTFSGGRVYPQFDLVCNPSELSSKVKRGLPWRVVLRTGDEVEIRGCKSERTAEICKVQLSLGIMIAVIICSLIQACSMIITVARSGEPTLVTLGDAVDSFLRIPDLTTMGMCSADRRFVKRKWRAGPRQWEQKEVQRWWTSVSRTRWTTFIIFYLIVIIAAGVLLASGMARDGVHVSNDFKSMWARGFGRVNNVSLVALSVRNLTGATLLANLPQAILSFLYLTYNSLFTCMLSGHEWSLFGHHHRTLRVTSPRPGQRSTYWLQMPYTYAIPLLTLSGLLHWLTSQSLFLVRVEISDTFGGKSGVARAMGYSCIATVFMLTLGILGLLAAVGIGYRQFSAEITTVGDCSAAISAACHALEDTEAIIGKKVRWGDVGIALNREVRHLAFSSEEGVERPVFGETYAGERREAE